MVASYKLHDLKPGTPVIHYKCAFCGKEGVRRASKVKNVALIFCDNHCAQLYRHAKKRKDITVTNANIKNVHSIYIIQIFVALWLTLFISIVYHSILMNL